MTPPYYASGEDSPPQFRETSVTAWATAPNRHNITTAVALNTDLVIE